jgi:hypothetical protein
MIRLFIALCVSIMMASALNAQNDCSQQPAPCPQETLIDKAKDIAERTKDNDTYEQELQMESTVRNFLTDEVQRIAKANNWSVYELIEAGMDGPPFIFISYTDWQVTPFNKRPPDRYQISFIFITNQDSLQAWRDYLVNDVQSQSNKLVQQYQQSQNENPLLKQYEDSVEHYSQLLGELIQKDYAAYSKALQDNDKKSISTYEGKQNALQQKQDFFTKKLQDMQTAGFKNFGDAQADWTKQIVAFAEGSLALVHFDINPYTSDVALDNAEEDDLSRHAITVPGAFHASITNNHAKPSRQNYEVGTYDFTFQNPSCVGTILFGNYLPKADNNYTAVFAKNFHDKAGVIASEKTITCDKVQNIQVHVEGGNHYVQSIINTMDWKKLVSLL